VHAAKDVGFELTSDLFVGGVLKPTKLAVAGIVDEDINALETVLGGRDGGSRVRSGRVTASLRQELVRTTERCLGNRRNTESAIAVRILNHMLDLGRPDSARSA
jgi:hypothetical protein